MSVTETSLSNDNRLNFLAHHKVDLLVEWNRPSVYWPTKAPSMSQCGLSKRQEELSQPKHVHKQYKQDRPSAVWPVKSSSLLAASSPRIEQLAQAKQVNSEWRRDRPACSIVSEAAKKVTASPRVVQLAMPKQRPSSAPTDTIKFHEKRDDSACSKSLGTPTSRTEALATPKVQHPDFQHDLPVERKVPASALHAQASDRVCQLAKPKIRKGINEGYDPYKISPATKNADASSRTLELSVPPGRRVRTKKV
uniref:Testicular haploid expressed gene protein-like n=1 Tax=Leptobrachium leishanense TaxID=445787 RepID=A0A8C5LQN1_9ANUR